MSDGTVQTSAAYFNGQWLETVKKSDYDALRTQARELARALVQNRIEACPFMYGSTNETAWLKGDREYQLAQAVLKEEA